MAATPSAEPAIAWQPQGSYSDILFDLSDEGIARITINRPHKRNAFRPQTVTELFDAFSRVRDNPRIGVVLFTGAAPPPMAAMPSALAATRACGVMAAMWATTGCPA